jgi:hypothetical protein
MRDFDILNQLGMWEEKTLIEYTPPVSDPEIIDEPVDKGWPHYEEPFVTIH